MPSRDNKVVGWCIRTLPFLGTVVEGFWLRGDQEIAAIAMPVYLDTVGGGQMVGGESG